MKNYGNREDKTRMEVTKLLHTLSTHFKDVAETIDDIAETLYNEEYEEDDN